MVRFSTSSNYFLTMRLIDNNIHVIIFPAIDRNFGGGTLESQLFCVSVTYLDVYCCSVILCTVILYRINLFFFNHIFYFCWIFLPRQSTLPTSTIQLTKPIDQSKLRRSRDKIGAMWELSDDCGGVDWTSSWTRPSACWTTSNLTSVASRSWAVQGASSASTLRSNSPTLISGKNHRSRYTTLVDSLTVVILLERCW